jgi:hypothetical protein
MLCATAMAARFGPRRFAMRRNWALRMRRRVVRSQLFPMPVMRSGAHVIETAHLGSAERSGCRSQTVEVSPDDAPLALQKSTGSLVNPIEIF